MGISSLRPFLRSLCCNTPWNYAMFWRIKDQHEKILVWEDSFCDNLKPRDPMLGPMENFYLGNSNKTFSAAFTSNVIDETFNEVGLAVTEMASASHLMGKGVVGRVALTGETRWINFTTDMCDPVLVSECPDEWLLQFAAGIKTILLLPVLPHGVIQLGSLEMVSEDAKLIANVKHKFEIHKSSVGCNLGSSTGHFSPFVESSIASTEKIYEDHKAIDSVWTKTFNLSAKQVMPVYSVDPCGASAMMSANIVANGIERNSGRQSFNGGEYCQFLSDDSRYSYNVTENNSVGLSSLNEKTTDIPYLDFYNGTMFGDLNDLMDDHFVECATEPTSTCFDFDNTVCETGIDFSNFNGDLELQIALEPNVVDNPYQYAESSSLCTPNEACNSTGYGDPFYAMDVSGALSAGFFMSEVEVEQLLEAVVAHACTGSDDSLTNTANVTSVDSPLDKPLTPPERPNPHTLSALVKEDTGPWSFLADSLLAQGRDTSPKFSAYASSGESTISVLTDKRQQRQQRKEGNCLKPDKQSRLSRTNKRRVHSGDNQKARPRDRQLIQDRIKELRELVPDSGKCSIDGLLDKTIKHMLHLRSMTDQADKLNQVLEKETDKKTKRTDEDNCGRESGTSWAVELGSEMQSCPIVVKDLDPPGHMLIEMLCTDFGRFLEITDVIHRSQLTILKGVMENSCDNSLARFIVEAPGSFHRLDIFWPLMQLLQQKSPPALAVA